MKDQEPWRSELIRVIADRRSIRSFLPESVDEQDFKKMVEIAKMAPNGSNLQPWHFLWIKNTRTIGDIGKIVEKKLAELKDKYLSVKSDDSELTVRIKPLTFFTRAPTVVCMLRGRYKTGLDHLLECADPAGYQERQLAINPSLQSVAAAATTFLLAAHVLGYGACWMTGPLIAKKEIEDFLNIENSFELVALIALGFPKKIPAKPKRKPFEEIVTIID